MRQERSEVAPGRGHGWGPGGMGGGGGAGGRSWHVDVLMDLSRDGRRWGAYLAFGRRSGGPESRDSGDAVVARSMDLMRV